ncbi:mannitol-1-phosphate 5-dehydrogenase [Spiroplasma alleghenense]|uniref:Mannitol-1-phosphate 5-dehydrogenase n=1 Tax=Spiroplasma alleghenense TaxID=216931 RepID=A0A345Z2W7_9MOLU|nr:mannitol-1-phosphate 5-dehydrogenase [Spiroplasma alleghenense]AXK50946.1 mannitol-1-phosphate 5-dehydrogenase [Spiroplasma alleghenense]
MKAIHFGAGNIGRGFIAPILFQDKKIEEIVFVDVNEKLVQQINQEKKYQVIEKGNQISKIEIKNIKAITGTSIFDDTSKLNFDDYSILTISIGQNNLKYILPQILKIISQRTTPLVIMCCENGNRVSTFFKDMILEQGVKMQDINFVDCVVDRIVPNAVFKNLDVEVEKYYSWVVNLDQWPKEVEKITSLEYSNNIEGEINKKICLLNGAHAAIGWYRWQVDKFKISFVRESLAQDDTMEFVQGYLNELVEIISLKYNFEKTDLKNYAKKIIERFTNPYLDDELERVCRNPIQKLQINERILNPLLFAIEKDLTCNYIKKTFKNALNYANPKDKEAVQLVELNQKLPEPLLICEVIKGITNDLVKKLV